MSFNLGRALDLSGIVAAAKAPPPPPGATYVTDVDTAALEPLLAQSAKFPIVLELNSPRANAAEMSADLEELANAAGGAYLLARVNVDAEPQIAAALGIQAVPTVIAVIAGQLAPLWQGTRSKEDAKVLLDQVLQVAAANGITGRAQPVSVDASAGPDPRYAAADDAMAAGDFELAVAEFDKLLNATPADAEAKAGRAQASLLARVTKVTDPEAALRAADARPDDRDAQLAAADVELTQGRLEQAFARVISVIRNASGEARDSARLRLLELFETVSPEDPAVLKARRDLMSALF
ncbi:MAG: tetratricopeptide repeat protein [Propionibacteriaceae bacterium]|nr:tetratricopeptide repeat protein [Propionibacteriaceae bacterium]